MRVIAGRFRGRALSAPGGRTTRPITDRIKETLFNVLGARFGLPGALPAFDVLDLFAGTGGLGIEAVSRGAAACIFVERDRRALRTLRANLDQLQQPDLFRVVVQNSWTVPPPATAVGYGLVFLDPPYRDVENPTKTLNILNQLAPLLRPEGLIVLRFESQIEFPVEAVQTLVCVDQRTYGRMRFLFFGRQSAIVNGAETDPGGELPEDRSSNGESVETDDSVTN